MPRANLKRKPRSRFTHPAWIIAIVVGVLTVTGMAMVVSDRNSAAPAPAATTDSNKEKSSVKTKASPVAANAAPAKSPANVAAKPVTTGKPANAAPAAAPKANVSTGVVKGEVVSVTGCLELDNQEYKLTKTEGADAPTKRTWKSGFFKKSGADLEVVDTSKNLRLVTHLGQRVTLTGAVNERTMEAWSLAVVSRSCEGISGR